jgi:16S rRNA (uracil1498-N3)-methyltransferase
MNRFLADNLDDTRVELSPAEARHATRVLRMKVGEELELFDGRGGRAIAMLAEVRKGGATVEVTQRLEPSEPPRPRIELAFAVPKGKRLDWLLEKATELGVATLQPVIFERSVAGSERLSSNTLERWRGHCISAAKQCGLDWLPQVTQPQPLSEYLSAEQCDSLRLMGDPGPASVPIGRALERWRAGQDVCVAVGPEGGFTDEERAMLTRDGFHGVKLGTTTLRVETACIALIAAVEAACDK